MCLRLCLSVCPRPPRTALPLPSLLRLPVALLQFACFLLGSLCLLVLCGVLCAVVVCSPRFSSLCVACAVRAVRALCVRCACAVRGRLARRARVPRVCCVLCAVCCLLCAVCCELCLCRVLARAELLVFVSGVHSGSLSQ